MQIVCASHNPDKVAELQSLLDHPDIELLTAGALGINDIAETGTTFIENAIIKARHASQCSGQPALADDSGLMVSALNGAPGVHTARFAGEEKNFNANMEKVLHLMADVPKESRQAYFICVLCFMRHADDPLPIISQGIWAGHLMQEQDSHRGFGYEPIFWVPDYNCSAAKLERHIKNKISHRAQAVKQLFQVLQSELVCD